MTRAYNGNQVSVRQAKQIQELLESAEGDRRLTEAQRYSGLLEVFGCDPLILAAKRLQRAMAPQSKVVLSEETIQKLLIAIHDRVVPMPDQKRAKTAASDDQFELTFSWQQKDEVKADAFTPIA